MTSKYKKKRKKTRKKMKGGTTSTVEVAQMNEIAESFKCMTGPFCWISKMFEQVHTEIKNSIEMNDNILREPGLFLRNVYHLGGESTLKGIIGDVCFDIFDENVCETKINHLLYKNKLPDIPEKKNKPETIQSGGAIQDENKKNNEDMSINAKRINFNNISMNSIDYKKDYIKQYIYNQFQPVDLQKLYNILKYMKVMKDIYEPIGEITKPDPNPPVSFVTNDKQMNTYEDWKLCSNYQQGKNVTEEVKEKCKVDNRPTMYEQSTMEPTIMNYEPVFTNCFFDMVDVLKDYYTIDYDKNNDDFGATKKIKELEPDLRHELKEVYKVIKYFNIDEQLSDIFKDKMEPLSDKDK